MVTYVSNFVKQNLSPNYVFVRYMGPKFAIVFSGADVRGVSNFMRDIKQKIEMINVQYANDYKGNDNVNKDSNNEITSYDVILDVLAMLNGTSFGIQEVYYTIDSFGEGNVEVVDSFLTNYLGGEN